MWFIIDVVLQSDLSPIEAAIQRKDAGGQRPYHPQMMMVLPLYAYCTGVFPPRKIKRVTYEDLVFRVIAGDTQPYLTSINPPPRKQRDRVSCRPIGLLAFIVRRPGA